jgi:hypothetical protein
MKFSHKNKFLSFILLATNYLFLFATPANAQSAWSGKCVASGDVATIQGLECLFGNILQVIVGLAGIIFFVMFVMGGFQYLFSTGDQKKAATASTTLTMAIMGLVGVVASYLILKLIQTITGANITNFVIPS